MPNSKSEAALEALRRRVVATRAPSLDDSDALTRALHDLEVYQAELEIQNQDLIQTQLLLSQAKDRYQALFYEALTPYLLMTTAGVVQEANRAAIALVDRPKDRVIGKPLVLWLRESDHVRLFRHLVAVAASQSAETIELEFSSTSSRPHQVIMKSTRFSSEGTPLLFCQLTDVTEQRLAERHNAQLERRLRESEKLEAVGRVAANIAHDVNNVLASVISLAEFSIEQLPDDSPIREDLLGLLDASWRGARLMRGLLGLSKASGRTLVPVDLSRVVERAAAMLMHRKVGVDVECTVGPSVIVLGDEDEVFQAVLNVAANGLDAMDRGRLSVSCHQFGATAKVVVRDTGVGMSPETLARAFEPLFTTKSASGGSGLGLSIVRKSVTELKGIVELSSELGVGTTVTIELPALAQPPRPAEDRSGARPHLTALRVIVIDDDDRVRSTTRRQLEKLGASVVDYPDGPGALAGLKEGLRCDAAVVDINMPGWSGPEFVARAFREVSVMPVVFVTGASGELLSQDLLDRRYVRLVRKPWSPEEISSALRAVISELP